MPGPKNNPTDVNQEPANEELKSSYEYITQSYRGVQEYFRTLEQQEKYTAAERSPFMPRIRAR